MYHFSNLFVQKKEEESENRNQIAVKNVEKLLLSKTKTLFKHLFLNLLQSSLKQYHALSLLNFRSSYYSSVIKITTPIRVLIDKRSSNNYEQSMKKDNAPIQLKFFEL